MANPSGIRDEGCVDAGDDIGNSVPVETRQTAEFRATDVDLLEEIDDLLTELFQRVRQLPAEMRGAIRAEVVELQRELEEPSRDKTTIGTRLSTLKSAVSVAPPLAEIIQDVAYLVAELTH